MTNAEIWEKRNWFLMEIGYFAAGYLSINWITAQRTDIHDVSLSWDHAIPFVSTFILGYLLVYLSIILFYLVLKDIHVWRRAILSFITVTTLCFVIYLIYPVEVTFRPDLITLVAPNLTEKLTIFYYAIDEPFNAMPSIHIAFPTLCVLVTWNYRRVWRWIFAAMAVSIAVSVILVKQHYIMDVVAGVAIAIVGYTLVLKTQCWWEMRFFAESGHVR